MSNFTLYNDDCLNTLKSMDENSIDSCVTDPPYGLSFMGKHWDYDVPSAEIWREVLRVLKPGGHLLAFFGSRTYHRGVVQIEDAGFEIRDQIMWLYGSGFPKSHNIGKSIDKTLGVEGTYGEKKHSAPSTASKGWDRPWLSDPDALDRYGREYIAASVDAKQWEGWGTALKPAHEPIVVARKPIEEKTIAANVLKHGTGAINIDESRVVFTSDEDKKSAFPGGKLTSHGKGSLSGPGSAQEIQRSGFDSERNDLGRWPANVIHDGSDEVVEKFPHTKSGTIDPSKHIHKNGKGNALSGSKDGSLNNYLPHQFHQGDEGSAARFFYSAKASKSDRDEGLEQFLAKKIVTFQTANGASGKPSSISENRNTEYKNTHPTVKPTDLMKYLVKLTTHKDGVILDPFMGSGTTGKACGFEGYKFIGIERDPEYFEIAKARIEHAYKNKTVSLEQFFE